MDNTDSIIDLLKKLVRVSSRASVDDYEPIAELARTWLREHHVACEPLRRGAQTVGLVAVVNGAHRATQRGPVYMLNATLDTAGFGDVSRWTDAPTSARVRRGWMYGRGTADSKAGAALFSHLATEFEAEREGLRGRLVLLLDLDEHTGGFAGVRRYFDKHSSFPRPNGVFIGYPGNDRLVVGSRGFTRAVLTIHGQATHSGAARERGVNAVLRAAQLAQRLAEMPLRQRERATDDFPLPPQLTITAIEGGAGFSMVPDTCRLLLDVRLTPTFSEAPARRKILELVRRVDGASPTCPATTIEWQRGWPAYRISDAHPMVRALRGAAEHELHRTIAPAVAGPSNIGNFLETLKIPAISGFGVNYRGAHALDECIELASLEPVYRAYRRALRDLFDWR